MNSCEHSRAQMAFYLDDELHDGERQEFEAHLQSCVSCGNLLAQERLMLRTIRAAQPLYTAPPELRARINELLTEQEETLPFTAPVGLRVRLQQMLQPALPTRAADTFSFGSLVRWGQFSLLRTAVFSLLITTFVLAGTWLTFVRRDLNPLPPPSDFARMAVDSHLRRLRGQLPLEIVTDSPLDISDWFTGKVSFSLKLPNYQEASGQETLYRLEGARLVGFNNDYAAFVAYEMRQRPITLVVTSNGVAMPSGGEEIVSKGLRFHYDTINGLKVITWADRGLTYALVSDLEERGQQSCIVCHEGTKDRDFIESLKPAR